MLEATLNPTPSLKADAFVCPHCRHFAKQRWGQSTNTSLQLGASIYGGFNVEKENVFVSKCDACNKIMLWKDKSAVWPKASLAPEAHQDFPKTLIGDYQEARQIYNESPRASAALLRLTLQKLCHHLGAPGKNIDADIQYLYDEFRLGRRVRDSMDILRVIGNNAVHPGEINLEDDREISLGLFRMINFVVEKAISEPNQIDSMYAQLPEGAREAIERRDVRSIKPGKAPLESPTNGVR